MLNEWGIRPSVSDAYTQPCNFLGLISNPHDGDRTYRCNPLTHVARGECVFLPLENSSVLCQNSSTPIPHQHLYIFYRMTRLSEDIPQSRCAHSALPRLYRLLTDLFSLCWHSLSSPRRRRVDLHPGGHIWLQLHRHRSHLRHPASNGTAVYGREGSARRSAALAPRLLATRPRVSVGERNPCVAVRGHYLDGVGTDGHDPPLAQECRRLAARYSADRAPVCAGVGMRAAHIAAGLRGQGRRLCSSTSPHGPSPYGARGQAGLLLVGSGRIGRLVDQASRQAACGGARIWSDASTREWHRGVGKALAEWETNPDGVHLTTEQDAARPARGIGSTDTGEGTPGGTADDWDVTGRHAVQFLHPASQPGGRINTGIDRWDQQSRVEYGRGAASFAAPTVASAKAERETHENAADTSGALGDMIVFPRTPTWFAHNTPFNEQGESSPYLPFLRFQTQEHCQRSPEALPNHVLSIMPDRISYSKVPPRECREAQKFSSEFDRFNQGAMHDLEFNIQAEMTRAEQRGRLGYNAPTDCSPLWRRIPQLPLRTCRTLRAVDAIASPVFPCLTGEAASTEDNPI